MDLLSRDLGPEAHSEEELFGGLPRTQASDANDTFDVIVVGGGAAGIGAAIGAKQAAPSSRVLIVESEGCLGGAGTHQGVNSFCGIYSVGPNPRRVVGEVWDEIHARLVSMGAASAEPDVIVALVQVSLQTPAEIDAR